MIKRESMPLDSTRSSMYSAVLSPGAPCTAYTPITKPSSTTPIDRYIDLSGTCLGRKTQETRVPERLPTFCWAPELMGRGKFQRQQLLKLLKMMKPSWDCSKTHFDYLCFDKFFNLFFYLATAHPNPMSSFPSSPRAFQVFTVSTKLRHADTLIHSLWTTVALLVGVVWENQPSIQLKPIYHTWHIYILYIHMSKEIVDSSSDRGYPCCWILRIFCSAKGSKTNVCCCLEKKQILDSRWRSM